jgi:hypothetical protein
MRTKSFLFLLLMNAASLTAQSQPTFWVSRDFLRSAGSATLEFNVRLQMGASKDEVNSLREDCETHIAATVALGVARPRGLVVEPPNLCRHQPVEIFANTPVSRWPPLLRDSVAGWECDAAGFPRMYGEHLTGPSTATNPNHALEVHPLLRVTCSQFQLDFTRFMRAHVGMDQMGAVTSRRCWANVNLFFRADSTGYSFQERGSKCGNFNVYNLTIPPGSVRAVAGGHITNARVRVCNTGPFTAALYTFAGTELDDRLALAADNTTNTSLRVLGLVSYDPQKLLAAVRTQAGNWRTVTRWTSIPTPLAIVGYGVTTDGCL